MQNYGAWVYALLFLVIFVETGVVVMPFLPGDSLLFVVGALCGAGLMSLPLSIALLTAAAMLGNQTQLHDRALLRAARVPVGADSRWFNKRAFDQAHDFYEKYGGITIVAARFMPFLRTFAPFVAGVAQMTRSQIHLLRRDRRRALGRRPHHGRLPVRQPAVGEGESGKDHLGGDPDPRLRRAVRRLEGASQGRAVEGLSRSQRHRTSHGRKPMELNPLPAAALLEGVIRIVRQAGTVVMDVYATDFAVRGKHDASPVTDADERAEAVIVPALEALLPGVPVVAEEAVARGHVPRLGGRFWLVDPLDGTKEFVSRNGEFTVNVALIEAGVPVLGVVLAPALGRLFAGATGLGAFMEGAGGRRAIACRSVPADGLTVMASRSHGDAAALAAFLAGRKVASLANAGSSLKLCLVAAGEADLYPRLGRTMEWDIAAGHAVLRAAGGEVHCLDETALRYGKPGFENPHFYASGGPSS